MLEKTVCQRISYLPLMHVVSRGHLFSPHVEVRLQEVQENCDVAYIHLDFRYGVVTVLLHQALRSLVIYRFDSLRPPFPTFAFRVILTTCRVDTCNCTTKILTTI